MWRVRCSASCGLFSYLLLLNYAGFPLAAGNECTVFEVIYFRANSKKSTRFHPIRRDITDVSHHGDANFGLLPKERDLRVLIFHLPNGKLSFSIAFHQGLLIWRSVYLVLDCHNKAITSRGLFILFQNRRGLPTFSYNCCSDLQLLVIK